MSIHEIASRFDDRPGYSLVSFGSVGLPVYRIITSALTLVKKQFPPIDEFVLRSTEIGLHSIDEIAGFLGLDRIIVEASLTNLIRSDDVFVRDGSTVELTKKGKVALVEEAFIKPSEQTIVFEYDGLLRSPKWFGPVRLLPPSEAKRDGLDRKTVG